MAAAGSSKTLFSYETKPKYFVTYDEFPVVKPNGSRPPPLVNVMQ
jgi:hypothetical protein